jgi:predicted dinucleotide-binding enzyme
MRIGIVGTGNMGETLGLRWARAGHEVLFGSRQDRSRTLYQLGEYQKTRK